MDSWIPDRDTDLTMYLKDMLHRTSDVATLALITTVPSVLAATTIDPDQRAALTASSRLLPLAHDLLTAVEKQPCSHVLLAGTLGSVILIPLSDTVGLVAVTTTLKLGMLLDDLKYVAQLLMPLVDGLSESS